MGGKQGGGLVSGGIKQAVLGTSNGGQVRQAALDTWCRPNPGSIGTWALTQDSMGTWPFTQDSLGTWPLTQDKGWDVGSSSKGR